MSKSFTLEKVEFVLDGTFAGLDVEDARWGLIARGALVKNSVTKATAALVAGDGTREALVKKAKSLGKPILDVEGLRALLAGSTLHEVLARSTMARPTPTTPPPATPSLQGLRVAICGKLRAMTHAAAKAELEKLGAIVTKAPSPATNLVILGEDSGFQGVDVLDEGTAFLTEVGFRRLLAGAPLSDFVGAPEEHDGDPAERIRALVLEHLPELRAIDVGGEVWQETLTLTVTPAGKLVSRLVHLGGTPLHAHVRLVLQRIRWPRVRTPCTVEVPITFGP